MRAFVDGLELLAPGVVTVPLWRPEAEPEPGAERRAPSMYGAVARKR
ncbi:SAM-dependent methyltransferase [Kitasatospora sp. NPDC017646]